MLVVWTPLTQLPPPKRKPYGRDAFYDRLVAGREVRRPVEAAIGFLTKLPD